MSVISRFLRDEGGATAIEYGLIAAGISVVIIGVVTQLGGKLVNYVHRGEGRVEVNLQGAQRRLWRSEPLFTSATATTQRR